MLGCLAWSQQSSSSQNMSTGKAFLDKAAQINLGEIELGKLAEQKGHNSAIRDFGKRMVEDHSKAQDQLKVVAEKEGISLPTQPATSAMDLHHQLMQTSGAAFDQLYIQHMLSGHRGAIDAFDNEIEHGHNPEIKSYAENVLPVIQDHIRIAEDVAGKMELAGKNGLNQPDKAIAALAKPE